MSSHIPSNQPKNKEHWTLQSPYWSLLCSRRGSHCSELDVYHCLVLLFFIVYPIFVLFNFVCIWTVFSIVFEMHLCWYNLFSFLFSQRVHSLFYQFYWWWLFGVFAVWAVVNTLVPISFCICWVGWLGPGVFALLTLPGSA